MNAKLLLFLLGLIYSIWASIKAYKETGKSDMLWYPSWIDKNSGVSAKIRMHGVIAFTLTFIFLGIYLYT